MKKSYLLAFFFMASAFSQSFAQSSCPLVTNLRVSNITNTSATFDWDAGPFTWLNVYDSYAVEYRPSNTSTWIWFGGGSDMHQAMSVFLPGTSYDVRVTGQYTYSSGTCPPSAVLTFTTTGSAPPPVPYCTAKGSSTTYGWINSVKFGTINNPSGNNNGYSNFTALSTNITGNTVIPLTVQAAAKKTPATQYWTVYVDLNNDGDFFDAGETISTFVTIAGETSTQNIIIPTTLTGNHRMRIKMAYYLYGAGGPCGTFNYGEVEDYTVNINASAAPISNAAKQEITTAEKIINNTEISIYPNPASVYLTLSGIKETIRNLKVYDMSGRIVIEKAVLTGNNQLNISQLQRGSYLLTVTTKTNVITQKFIKN